MNRSRIAAVIRKELSEYRRNRFVVVTMIVYPATFTALPIASFFAATPPSAAGAALDRHVGLSLLYLLVVPVIVPATIAGYSIVGEREAGTLEPLLTTPIRPDELLLGKAAAVFLPALAIAYGVFGVFLLAVELFADPVLAGAVFASNQVLAQPVFIPLLAAWSIVVGIAVSSRASDVRVAQQLTVVGSLPPLALTSLMGFGLIDPTLALGVVLGGVLLAVDVAGWRLVAARFDRERLVTGSSPRRAPTASSQSGPTPQEGTEEPSATLRLTREGLGIELRRGTFDVLVDGERAGSIERHQTVELSVRPGRHVLSLRAGRYSSRLHDFDAAGGDVVEFRCHGAMVWPRYVASIVKPDVAISLRRE